MRQCRPCVIESLCSELHDIKEAIKKCCHEIANKECTCRCECPPPPTPQPCECNCTCECTCNCNGGGGGGSNPCCCIAESQCDDDTGESSVLIPANSCITKIYASFAGQGNSVPYARVTITFGGVTRFCHYFGNETNEAGSFDTTLVQPLCVGDTQATATITPIGASGSPSTTAPTAITVVYCPDCCGESPVPEIQA